MCNKGFCGSCKYFKPNGGVTSNSVLYSGQLLPENLGSCDCSIEPAYSRLKNEHNSCDNWVEKEPETKE